MKKYKIANKEGNSIYDTETTGSFLVTDTGYEVVQEYLKWVEEGNEPDAWVDPSDE